MAEHSTHALSDVLDRLEDAVEGDCVKVDDIVEHLGRTSFAGLMLIFSLVSATPASAIPGLTAAVAVIDMVLVLQMIVGRDHVWLPNFITKRDISSDRLCQALSWLRKPVRFVERFMRPRLKVLMHRPWLWLPLIIILALTLVMPFLEAIPMSGSIASAIVALIAAGLLTNDGVVVVVAMILLVVAPLGLWQAGVFG